MYGYVYLTTNKLNGKQYVGQHIKSYFDTKYKGSGKALLKAISKYGFDNFECHIIDTAESQEELNDKEYVYVELYQTMTPNGYNLMEGGGCKGRPSNETKQKIGEASKRMWEDPEIRQKMSEIKTGEKNPFYGKNQTEETKRKLSEANKGKTLTEDTKQKISEASKTRWEDPEERRKQSEAHTGENNGSAKKCIFRDKEFGCIKDAQTYAKSIGIGRIKFRKELIIL